MNLNVSANDLFRQGTRFQVKSGFFIFFAVLRVSFMVLRVKN